MNPPVIQVENLGKKYTLGHQSEADTLRDRVAGIFNRKFQDQSSEEFWALREVSFAIQPGEVVGIIGRNGAGKSTLLKILSRITEPTTGKITLDGRVASLLEVGTGFHPELTGRENVFLNGAILGMSRSEIRKNFDEIVAFAEIERFLDTPVKHYSSGMYVRLAFAVAAHLEPEILIVDEVLAVGDAQFQKKCLGKMQEVSKNQGRTVLFVSHNLTTIQSLTTRCLYLRNNALFLDGPTLEVTSHYFRESSITPLSNSLRYTRRCAWLEVESVEILVNGHPSRIVPSGSTVTFRAAYRCRDATQAPKGIECTFVVNSEGRKLVNFWSEAGHGKPFSLNESGIIECVVPDWPFREAPMSLQIAFTQQRDLLLEVEEAALFSGADSDRFGTGTIPAPSEGMVLLPHQWSASNSDS